MNLKYLCDSAIKYFRRLCGGRSPNLFKLNNLGLRYFRLVQLF